MNYYKNWISMKTRDTNMGILIVNKPMNWLYIDVICMSVRFFAEKLDI